MFEVPRDYAISVHPELPARDVEGRVYAGCVKNSMIYGNETRLLLADVGFKFERADMPMIRMVPTTIAYIWWNCQVFRTCKLLSTHPFKSFPRRFSGPESVCSG